MRFITLFFYYVITALIGALFLYGAYTKIIGIQNFEWTLAETGLFNFGVANFLSRVVIAIEAVLGFLFLFNLRFAKSVYTVAALLLAFFNIFLLWVMHTYGMSGNCGCFGDAIQMTPMQASIKNLVIIACIYYLSCFQYEHKKWLPTLLIAGTIGYIGYTIPPDIIFVQEKDETYNEPIALAPIQEKVAVGSSFRIDSGKHVLCILSAGCHHCKSAARKIGIMHKRNANLPFYFAIAGDTASVQLFLQESKSAHVPYQINTNYAAISALISLHTEHSGYPKFLWVDNGKLVRISQNYFNLNQSDIEDWTKTK